MVLRLLLGGLSTLEAEGDDEEKEEDDIDTEDNFAEVCDDEKQESYKQSRVLSIAQDFINTVSRATWTSKNIGLASILHQTTR